MLWLAFLLTLAAIAAFLLRPRRFLHVPPRYQDLLASFGSPDDFLNLPGLVVCGHHERHVVRVLIAGQHAYLKREHRIPRRDRVIHCIRGFGFVSKSQREAVILERLAHLGIDAPDVMALGEDGKGRAFLLVRALEGAVDLRLQARGTRDVAERRALCDRVGTTLARIHLAGIVHGDLYAKHILIDDQGSVLPIDWQRARFTRIVEHTWLDLAALDATLPEELASPRERIACLRAYARTIDDEIHGRLSLRALVSEINRRRAIYLRRGRIKEQRKAIAQKARQGLIWMDGEALCVTPALLKILRPLGTTWIPESMANADDDLPCADAHDQLPAWLVEASRLVRIKRLDQDVLLSEQALGRLRGRRFWRPLTLLHWLRGKTPASRNLTLAARIFRLERHGVPVPRLYAVGQRPLGFGRWTSFLLTEQFAEQQALADWLAEPQRTHCERWAMVRKVGVLVRRLHDARCDFRGSASLLRSLIVTRSGITLRLVLADLEAIRTVRRDRHVRRRRDLLQTCRVLASSGGSRTDILRFLQGYVQRDPLRDREDFPMLLFAASLTQGRLTA